MWKCKTCIHREKQCDLKGICISACKDVCARLNRKNQYYQEIVGKPHRCADCVYLCKRSTSDGYMCRIYNWDWEDRVAYYKPVRKNYLKKNTPTWCQLEIS